ncbi:MAG: flagellar motor switch protein FliN [Rhodospirillaceae bacterium]|jgi:flagellar motor switch protein FliN|nr:flagellar motor switch protein FliN [Rhodospirillaceae bacterium]MBT4219823.1 flagellar motor switch protein FliN [Rhodospirillaceae bacterium]MBT4463718.1 flagellar motor switch protein FliN [Rhodospirillaceae bacterium]MBT5014491.1 flagellar motor switch protein FliN [Rhodospirillaceae bacterium]MBT5309321.1 flagellar motor switch protein FliN [Rhodospirillaceae bacterium]
MADEDDMDMEAAMAEQAEAPAPAPMASDDDDEGAVYGISVDVIAVLGTSMMPISQILKLGRGAVVELDRLVGEEIELSAEKQIIAKGEVVVIEDRLGVSITKIMKSQ